MLNHLIKSTILFEGTDFDFFVQDNDSVKPNKEEFLCSPEELGIPSLIS
jgi:hypothetical protein